MAGAAGVGQLSDETLRQLLTITQQEHAILSYSIIGVLSFIAFTVVFAWFFMRSLEKVFVFVPDEQRPYAKWQRFLWMLPGGNLLFCAYAHWMLVRLFKKQKIDQQLPVLKVRKTGLWHVGCLWIAPFFWILATILGSLQLTILAFICLGFCFITVLTSFFTFAVYWRSLLELRFVFEYHRFRPLN